MTEPYKFMLNVLHAVLGVVRGLVEFFRLTEEERFAAGIYLRNERRDE